MGRRQSPLFLILAGWTCLSIVYFIIQAYIVLGSNFKAAFLPLLLAFGILEKNIGEPLFDKVIGNYVLPDYFAKYVHKYPILKTVGLVHASSCNLFELLRTLTYGCVCLASIIDTARVPHQHSAANLVGSLAFRVVLGALLIFKSPFESSLSRLVGCLTKGAAAGHSTMQLLLKALECLVLCATPTSGVNGAGGDSVTEASPSEGSTAGSTSGNNNSSTLPHRSSAPTGSATLLAVLLAAGVESAVMTVALATPLLLDLFSTKLTPKSAGLYLHPMLAPARLSAPLFSQTWCALLIAGAAVQCVMLFFVAGYLTYRRAIALELRMHAAATASSRNATSTANTTGNSSTSTSNHTNNGSVPTPDKSRFSLGVGSFLLSLLDCDVRLSVSLENCRGSGRLSSADAFSAGLQASATGGSVNNSGAYMNNNAAPSLSHNNPGAAGNHNKNGGKGRLSVNIPATSASSSTSHSSLSSNSGSPRKDLPVVSTVEKLYLQQLQFAPQPHMLLLCVLPVLLVAAVQLGQVLLGHIDSRCSWGYAVSGGAALLLVSFLRDAIPRACCSESGISIAGTTTSSAAGASMHGVKQ